MSTTERVFHPAGRRLLPVHHVGGGGRGAAAAQEEEEEDVQAGQAVVRAVPPQAEKGLSRGGEAPAPPLQAGHRHQAPEPRPSGLAQSPTSVL